MTERVIGVKGQQPYDVTVGPGVMSQVASAIPDRAEKVLVVHSEPMSEVAGRLVDDIAAAGKSPVLATVPDAEAGKTPEVLIEVWTTLGREGFTRSDTVVGLGGGAITDLAGFVAASWLRGVAVVQVPTTLLAMVDAAVGGKTGVNTEEGKNLVGAFHVPSSVWCDTEMLRTLPRADLVAGLAEIVKAGFIRDTEILGFVDDNLETFAGDLEAVLPVLTELIARAIQVKADVVGEDLKESFLREILNYGHTFGHAIEKVEGYTWRHGEAISVGMVYAAELSRLDGRLGDDDVDLHRRLLGGLGLPISYTAGRWDDLIETMRLDKKTRGSLLRFVILESLGNPVRLEGPDGGMLRKAYDAISE